MAFRWTRDKPLYRVGDSDVEPGEVFEASDAVQDRFGQWLESVETDGDDADADAQAEEQSADAEAYTCGVNGCGRTVDSPEETCWQHDADEA